MDESEEKEETIPLVDKQSIEGDVWILLPIRYTDRGAVPKKICLSLGPGTAKVVHVFKSAEATCHPVLGQIYVFRTTLSAEEMLQCSIEVWGDDIERDMEWMWKKSPPFSVKLLDIPPIKEDEFLNDFHVKVDLIFSHHDVLFRGTRYDRPSIISEVNGNNEEHWKTIKNAKDVESIKEKSLRCMFHIFNTQIIRLSSIDQLHESQKSNAMESVINIGEQVDFLPFRLPLQCSGSASDSFAEALENVRETFVTSPYLSSFDSRLHEGLKRNFDLKFLKLSNLQASDEKPYYIVYDFRKKELQFVEQNYEDPQEFWSVSYIKQAISWIYSSHFGFQTTNKGLQAAVRKNWIKYQCLQGQDDEFNIFRSICFAPPSNVNERYHIGFVALSLQILLCIGITMDSAKQWSDTSLGHVWETIISLEYEVDATLIVIISTLTFAFILQRLRKTITTFERFYRNLKEVCIIPQAIIALDFTSNVVVGTWLAMATPFFLLQSEDIQTVVLNSFALTIFIELDDLANVFESDEAYLLQEDANGMKRIRDPNPSGVVKREIGRQWTGFKRLQMLAKFLFSPVYESYKILESLLGMCCCSVVERQNHALSKAITSGLNDYNPTEQNARSWNAPKMQQVISGEFPWKLYCHHNGEITLKYMILGEYVIAFYSENGGEEMIRMNIVQEIHLGKVSHTLQNASSPHKVCL